MLSVAAFVAVAEFLASTKRVETCYPQGRLGSSSSSSSGGSSSSNINWVVVVVVVAVVVAVVVVVVVVAVVAVVAQCYGSAALPAGASALVWQRSFTG